MTLAPAPGTADSANFKNLSQCWKRRQSRFLRALMKAAGRRARCFSDLRATL